MFPEASAACTVDASVAWAFGGADELFPALPPPVCRLFVAPPPLPLSLRWATTLGLAGTTILGAVRCGGGCAGKSGVLGSRTSERGWSAPAHSFPAKVRVAPTATSKSMRGHRTHGSIATAQDGSADTDSAVCEALAGVVTPGPQLTPMVLRPPACADRSAAVLWVPAASVGGRVVAKPVEAGQQQEELGARGAVFGLTPRAAARPSRLLPPTLCLRPRRIPTAPQGWLHRGEAAAVVVREGSTQRAPPRPR